MKKTLPLILIVIVMLVSCGEKKESAQNTLLKKVLAVHDEVMPKMGDIMKYKKQLNEKIDELTKADPEKNAEQIVQLKKAVSSLENSHEGMMSWMRQFDRNFEGKVEEDIMAYLNDQMTRIEAVSKETNAAIENAEELLKQ